MLIREAEPADLDRVAALTLAAYRSLPRPVTPAYERRLADVRERIAEGATVLVAEDDAGEVVGTVTLVLDDGEYFQHDYGSDGDAAFRMLAVDPAHAGAGVGRGLVDECIDRARAAGRQQLVITTMPWMTTARGMYERRGFVRRPDLDQHYPNGRGLAYVLELRPTDTDAPADRGGTTDRRNVRRSG